MASSATSEPGIRLRFRHRDGALLEAPREWEAATILLAGLSPDRWGDAQVEAQGQVAKCWLGRPAGADGPQVCADWGKANAGTWRVRVHAGGDVGEHEFRVEPRKLSPERFATMGSELEEKLPASIIIGLKRLGAFAGLHWWTPRENTLAQEIVRLRSALEGTEGLPGLLAVLRDAARQPHHVLASEERWTRTDAARQPVPAKLLAALARPGNMLTKDVPGRILDRRVEPSFDTYENRLLREFAEQVERRLRALKRAAEHLDGFRKEHGPALDQMLRSLHAARRTAAFLDGVGRLRGTPNRLTQVLLRSPSYQAVLRGYMRLQRSPRIRLDHPAMSAPVRDVPMLYEAWCTLVVMDELLTVAQLGGWQVTAQRLTAPGEVRPFVSVLPSDSHPLLVLQRGRVTASLFYKRRYKRRFKPGNAALRSISFVQEPDITLEVCDAAGGRVLHLLDPKYKLAAYEQGKNKPIKEDIDKMHAYRDAIRDQADQRVVHSAAILFPGDDRVYGDGIGALGLLPGSPRAGLQRWLGQILRRQDVGAETDEADDEDAWEALRLGGPLNEADAILCDIEGPEAVLSGRVLANLAPRWEELTPYQRAEAERLMPELVKIAN